jgi:DNA-binding NtrC family response regulator
MHEVVSLAVHVAAADVPVLITGPNGSGKEKLAEIVQANSRRAKKPFIKVNAGAIPDNLLESELFGAEPGAFTGAGKTRVGHFESADGGTLFLDEIGNLSPAGQAKLLRVLQTGEYQRLGSSATKKCDVRVISATNADLLKAIADKTFREDLYFRLNVIELRIPPLAERRDDIVPLAEHMLLGITDTTPPPLSDAARHALQQHDWPGNVRELQNCVRRASLVARGAAIEPADLGLQARRSVAPQLTIVDDGDLDRTALEAAISRNGGNVSRVAAELGLSRQALYRRMERAGIVLERRARTS